MSVLDLIAVLGYTATVFSLGLTLGMFLNKRK